MKKHIPTSARSARLLHDLHKGAHFLLGLYLPHPPTCHAGLNFRATLPRTAPADHFSAKLELLIYPLVNGLQTHFDGLNDILGPHGSSPPACIAKYVAEHIEGIGKRSAGTTAPERPSAGTALFHLVRKVNNTTRRTKLLNQCCRWVVLFPSKEQCGEYIPGRRRTIHSRTVWSCRTLTYESARYSGTTGLHSLLSISPHP